LGEVCYQHGETARAADLFEEALRLERDLDLPDGVAYDMVNLARVRFDLGELERAAALSAQGIRLFRDMGNQIGLANALALYGAVMRARGDPERAIAHLQESLRLLADLDERSAMPEHIELLADMLLDLGDAERAVRLLGAAEMLRQRIAAPPAPRDRLAVEHTLQSARRALGERATTAALAAGRSLSLERTLAESISNPT
jgi:tetratricopeptide (TPR) repeat protein